MILTRSTCVRIDLKTENKLLKKEIENVNKTAMAALNKAATNDKTLIAMEKRLKKIRMKTTSSGTEYYINSTSGTGNSTSNRINID